MQIVIKIQEDDFEKIKNTSFVENTEIMFHQSSEDRKLTMMLFRIMDAIKDGTPLPKGHGRLIDADNVIIEAKNKMKYGINHKYMECVIAHMNLARTIIEADKAESEVEDAE